MRTRRQAAAAAAAYLVITLAWTWPLATGLTRDLPADFGDPLLNAWILAWDATHLGRGWWSANIYFPHPLALAYSEHLLPQALSILPLYATTRNPILCYNVVFLATFVLSGLGMFLLARELTGRADAGFVAGLAFAFAPYRVASLPHVQVLSSAWMPFAIYGFRRYFVSHRPRALVGGATAWLLQNLSCGYYLMFFSPIVIAYLAWELITRRDDPAMRGVALACAGVTLATLPFLIPYLELRRLGFDPRALGEAGRYSADVYAYLTADPNGIWGSVARAFPNPEGALFPGLTIAVLAALSIARRPYADDARPLALLPLALVAVPLLGLHVPLIRISSVSRTLTVALVACAGILTFSRTQRRAVRAWLASPAGFFSIALVFAVAMSFGPEVHARGRFVADGVPYAAAYRAVPGFDGLRVPARFAMVVVFALAALAAFTIRSLRTAVVAGALIVIESLALPMPINQNDTNYRQAHLAPLKARVSTDDAHELYAFVASLPNDSAIVELPLGEPAFDVRYMFASTRHWKRLVNGYSGGAPADYLRLDQDLQSAVERPDRAWTALTATGATHVIVHEAMYDGGRGAAITEWLRSHGAREVASFPTAPSAGTSATADQVLVLK